MKREQEMAPDGGYETDVIWSEQHGRDRLTGIRVLAETEYRLAIKNGWAVALTVVFGAFSLGLLTFSGASVGPDGLDRIVASLTVLAVYLVPLAALAFGYDAIVGAEDDGWLQVLFALPIARWRIAAGSFLGRGLALVSAIAIGFGAAGLILLAEYGLGGWEVYAAFLFATMGFGVAFLGIALLVSTLTREKTHALGAALLIWAWFVLVHDLLALGLTAAFDLPDVALTAMVLTNPAGVFRVLVLGSLGAGGEAGFASVMASAGLSNPTLVIALVAWIIVPVGIAGLLMQRRRV